MTLKFFVLLSKLVIALSLSETLLFKCLLLENYIPEHLSQALPIAARMWGLPRGGDNQKDTDGSFDHSHGCNLDFFFLNPAYA